VNKEAVKACIEREIKLFQARSYDELVKLIKNPEHKWAVGPDGNKYGLEINVFYEGGRSSKYSKHLRVMVSGDDGGLSFIKPVTGSFIMGPDGTLE